MIGFNWIPLLSPKALLEFNPEEFKAHIRSLYHKTEPKRAEPVRTILPKLTAKGNISLLISRKPQWMSREEIAAAAKELKVEERLVWDYIAKKKIKVSSEEKESGDALKIQTIPLP